MIIYCDEINIHTALRVLAFATKQKLKLYVLDRPIVGWRNIFWRSSLEFFNIQIINKDFSAGQLYFTDGESVMSKALHTTSSLSFELSRRIMVDSPFLRQLNKKKKRQTILKIMAQSLFRSLGQILVRGYTVRYFESDKKEENLVLIVKGLKIFKQAPWSKYVGDLTLIFYTPYFDACSLPTQFVLSRFEWLRKTSIGMAIKVIRLFLKDLVLPRSKPDLTARPSLLLLQDEEISLDTSRRGQPHWFDANQPLDFPVVILEDDFYQSANQDLDRNDLKAHGFTLMRIENKAIFFNAYQERDEIKQLKNDFFEAVKLGILGSLGEKAVMFNLIDVLSRSLYLYEFVLNHRIIGFMTCESYKLDADAIRLIADELNVKTFSFQYSNLGFRAPSMASTADVMMSFSKLYHSLWQSEDVGPLAFEETGYVYSSAVVLVRPRSLKLKESLQKKGAKFIVCYFDESVTDDRFTFINLQDHLHDVRLLYEMVLQNPDIALIIKPQFHKNLPNNFHVLRNLRQRTLSTGRYIELSIGRHRNVVFPMEAAMASNVSIGHNIGGTASLEAALVGTRTVLINNCGYKGIQEGLYARCRILYPSLQDLIKEMYLYKQKDQRYADFGDWSTIIHEFDAFNDHQSAERMRNVLRNYLLNK